MTSAMSPVPPNHNPSCQRAEQDGCRCSCSGMMHQRDILVAAFQSRKSKRKFDTELTKLFGSPFSLLSTDPSAGERSRREWKSIATASEKKKRSQEEQRIVDVTVRDLLRVVHAIPKKDKTGWKRLLNDLTAKHTWNTVSQQIHAVTGPHDEASGFFWSSMLANAFGATWATRPVPAPSAIDITSFASTTSTVFDEARHPRARSGNTVKKIKEVAVPQTQLIASNVLAAALASSALPLREKLIVTGVVGAVTSADLWRHPSAVRYLLIPTVRLLRRDFGATFSLDSPSRLTEKIIDEELGQKWRDRGVW